MKCLLFLLLATSFFSCVSHQELVSFSEEAWPLDQPEPINNSVNLPIQPEDLLRITVHSIDPVAAAPFNLDEEGGANMRMGGNQGTQQLELFSGYFVDRQGYIDFPVLGRIEVAGITLEEAKFRLLERLKEHLIDPVVNIRYLNLKVTILGEVNAPGTIRLTNKRITLLEALGMAGDLTHYANRRNVLVIREEKGLRNYARINLQSRKVFESPYFYLQQNDVVYIEPIKARVATVADPAQRIIAYSSATLSLISLILALSR